MLSEKMTEMLSKQINEEYYSAYIYLAMSVAADQIGLKGTSSWLYMQAKEEMSHGTHMFQHVMERGEAPKLMAIEQPRLEYSSILEIFEEVLKHEQHVTHSINKIATAAMQESDHATYQFMMWFVTEQVEELASVGDVLDKIKLIGDNTALLLALDNELGTRTFVNPFPNQ